MIGLLALASLTGCRQDMHDQPVLEAYEESEFFADGRSGRMPIEGTVARGLLQEDTAFHTGLAGDEFVSDLPMTPSKELLERGRSRYEIFCSPCHDRVGNGRGMIVRRGFKRPASFHEARLREQPVGYYFNVMTRGFGEMSSYASMIKPEDRWAIAAYIRALQLSQNVELAKLDEASRETVTAAIESHGAAQGAGESAGEELGHD